MTEQYDTVNKPKHYMLFPEYGIEVRDVMIALVKKIEHSDVIPSDGMFISDYVQLMQYLMRFMDKNGFEDLEKSAWYLNKMIESIESLEKF